MKYEINQRNHFTYGGPVKQSVNQFRLKPIDDSEQACLSFEKKIVPETICYGHQDYWGNHVETFYLWGFHDTLIIETTSLVEVHKKQISTPLPFDVERSRVFDSDQFKQDYAEFLATTNYTSIDPLKIAEATEEIWVQSANPYDFVTRLNTFIYETCTYVPGSTTVKTTAEEVLEKKEGVCQDYTHLMLALCRHRGIPARYVSGYIYCGENSAMRGDAATHAWVEVAMPDIGWLGFDPTNNVLALDQHIRLAVGRDYKDIVPVKGVYVGPSQRLDVKVSVKKIENQNTVESQK